MGCNVRETRHGVLCLVLQWQHDGRGCRTQESLGVKPTEAARAAAERDFAAPIRADMRAGRFTLERYLEFFPSGAQASRFRAELGIAAKAPARPTSSETIADRYVEWIQSRVGRNVRDSLRRAYRSHAENYILPIVGHRPLAEFSSADVEQLRQRLENWTGRRGKQLTSKTIQNAITGTLRALLRDAGCDVDAIFRTLKWQRLPMPEPDVFSLEKRDEIVGWFAAHRGGHYQAFVATLALTGCRPSEAVALERRHFDPARCTLRIEQSRTFGQLNATKTRGSVRTITVSDGLYAILRRHFAAAIGTPTDPLFRNLTGGPISQRTWHKEYWDRCLKARGIRHRKWYALRHTFISHTLSDGGNLFGLAKYCGTSVEMIQRTYGRYVPRERGIEAHVADIGGAKVRSKRDPKAGGLRFVALRGGASRGKR